MRKCLFTTFVIGTICFTFFSEQLFSSDTDFANISSSMSFINSKVYTGSEILDLYNPLVFEITTTYQTQGGFLWLQKRWSGMHGTGLLFSNNKNNALIITNSHVVVPENLEGEYQCTIKRNSQEDACNVSLVAIGKDDLDLALLKVATDGTWEDFEVPFETSGNLNQGDPCFAIGNARGEGLSITDGIISKIEDYITTSTPVSPGNSGGPLILSKGAVFAGIITLQDRREGSQNMNYAIPVDYLLNQENWIFLEETLEDLDETKLLLGKMLR